MMPARRCWRIQGILDCGHIGARCSGTMCRLCGCAPRCWGIIVVGWAHWAAATLCHSRYNALLPCGMQPQMPLT